MHVCDGDVAHLCMCVQVDIPGYVCGQYAMLQSFVATKAPNLKVLLSLGGW